MELSTPVKDSVAQLYEIFRTYPLNQAMEACPCCHKPDAGKALLSKKLINLTPEDLWQYANEALQLWGGIADFKHFLPRIFEVLAEYELEWPWRVSAFVDAEIVMGKLRHGNWEDWPLEEQNAVRAFLEVMWRELIGARPTTESEPKAGEWLCVLGQAESNLSPYLNVWIQDDSLDANLNLARTLLTGAWTAQWNPFWGDRTEQIQQVDNWINGPAVRDKLRRAYEKWPNTPASEDLFNAAAMLQT